MINTPSAFMPYVAMVALTVSALVAAWTIARGWSSSKPAALVTVVGFVPIPIILLMLALELIWDWDPRLRPVPLSVVLAIIAYTLAVHAFHVLVGLASAITGLLIRLAPIGWRKPIALVSIVAVLASLAALTLVESDFVAAHQK